VPSGATSTLATVRDEAALPQAVWSATGNIAAVLRRRARVFGGPPLELRHDLDLFSTILWNPAGTALTYTFDRMSEECGTPQYGVDEVVPGGRARVLIAPTTRPLGALAWSPDGATLAVEAGPDRERRGRRHAWPKSVARHYGMNSDRGDAAVRRLVRRAARALRRGAGREETLARFRRDFARVAKRFDEAYRTVVRARVARELDRWLHAAGFARFDPLDDIVC
jgi:hypothetical protein